MAENGWIENNMFVKMLLFLCNFYKKEKKIEKE